MDVIFEEMVQIVWERGNGAVYGFGDAIAEGERKRGLLAGWEGDVLHFA